ncbi:MAG: TolC family protein [Bacteroidia bacterium]
MLVNIHKQTIITLLLAVVINATNAQVYTLKQCIDSAQVYNKNLKMGRNNIAIGEQKNKEAKANLLPKINANAEYKYFTNLPYQLMPLSIFGGPEGKFKEAQFGVPHNINANLALSMPLYNSQVYGAIQTSKIASELSNLQYWKTEEQLFFDISNLYYNAQIIKHQLEFIDGNLVNANKLLKNIQLLKEQLLAKGSDVNKVKLQLSQLNTQRESIYSKQEQVLNAIKFAMGIAIEQSITVENNIIFENNSKENTEITYSNSLDINISKVQSRIINSELSTLKKSKYIPSINLFGTYGTTGFGYDKQPNEFLKFFPIGFAGIQLNYPIFNGTVTQRKINQKKLEQQNSEMQINLVSEQNNMLIQNAKMQLLVAIKSVKTTEEQMQLAQIIYDQTLLQHKEGTANISDILIADNSLREAQQTNLTSIIDYMKANLELKKLTGNLSIKK